MPLARLVAEGDEDAKGVSLSALRKALARSPENRAEALEVGLLGNRVLGDAMSLRGSETQREAAALLSHLTLSWRACAE